MQPLVRRTWAKRGKTPIYRRKSGNHRKITAIGALCVRVSGRRPRLYFRLHPGRNANATVCVAYLEQLKLNLRGEVIIIWDRLLAHRSRKVKAWLGKNPRFSVEYFPPYAPELNPIEYAWGWLKNNGMANYAPADEESLRLKSKEQICRMRSQPRLLRAFLRHCPLRFG